METLQTETLTIQGMSCGHCVQAVRDALAPLDVDVADVQIGRATVRYDASQIDRGALVDAIEDMGYTVEAPA